MNTLAVAVASLALAAGPGEGLSTDRLDEYVRDVQARRKACGPTAVRFCLNWYGVPAEREELFREAKLGPEGTSLQSLVELCAARDLDPRAVNRPDRDVSALPAPCLLVVDKSHCVVYLGLTEGDSVRYYEPATDRVLTAERARVEQNWTGEAVLFGPPPLAASAFAALAAGVAGVLVLGTLVIRRLVLPS